MPLCCAQATPATGVRPGAMVELAAGTSILDSVLIGACCDQPRCTQYALAELLALRPAFDEADRNKLVKQVMHDEPVRPRKLNRACRATWRRWCSRRSPATRRTATRRPPRWPRTSSASSRTGRSAARASATTEKLWRWCRRNPLPASLVAGIVLVFLAGFAGVSWQWREAEAAHEDEKGQRPGGGASKRPATRPTRPAPRLTSRARLPRPRPTATCSARPRRCGPGTSPARATRRSPTSPPRRHRPPPAATCPSFAPRSRPPWRPLTSALWAESRCLSGDDPGSLAFSPDGRTLLTAGHKTGLDFWDVRGNRHLSSAEGLAVSKSAADRAVYLPGGQGLAVATRMRRSSSGRERARGRLATGTRQAKRTRCRRRQSGQRPGGDSALRMAVHQTLGRLLRKLEAGLALTPNGHGWLTPSNSA